MAAILKEVVASSCTNFSLSVLRIAQIPNTFDIVEKGINSGYFAHTVALAVW
jgi:hypothetical protein